MDMGRLLNGVLVFCKWITHFAVLNLLWIGCTFLGGIIFGIAPSTAAMYAVSRKASLRGEDIPVVKTFWRTYRKEFLRSNALAFTLIVIGLVWYFDLHFFRQFEGGIYTVLTYLMMLFGLTYIILLMYILPVFVHYDLKLFQYIKQALLIAFLHPANLIVMLIGSLSTYYFFISFPGFIPIFGFTIFAHLNMWLAFKCFENVENVKLETSTA
ncbi:hypothetical protein GCM10007216_13260 [Thalassobacillus devorans]|uniref:DUF624 domain-containing protein n=1 Tax=Thalassobacillus devorans TaxID=279813 RepID=A0ABQ1NRW4_9BACI|nr:YesL family protein [Thalassobacillus devorans]NIK28733.1 putative membrane protein YesL [Thalassobacillus devorans]GGC83979.1 hypothetical protein GCM10007216_13260 [Thalassobacillus devorans]